MNEDTTVTEEPVEEPIIETPSEPSEADQQIIDLLTSIDGRLETLLDYFALVNDAVRVILSYGLVWVPLIIVCWMLWWFFSQFLHKY